MDFYEVRESMLYQEERVRKVTLLRLELMQFRSIAAVMEEMKGNVGMCLHRFDTNTLKPLLADVCVLLPPDGVILGKLLDIPKAASLVNENLDHPVGYTASPDGRDIPVIADPQRNSRTAIWSNIRFLAARCDECEAALAELFGPLPGAVVRTP
jgi:hypothetical protein